MKKNNFNPILMRWILLAFVALALSACAKRGSNSLAPEGKIAISVSSVAHYGKGIGIAEFYINGRLSGHNYRGWGGSGNSCCMIMPMHPIEPLMVTVKWKTYRISFKEERWHEAIVPVHFAVPPGDGYGLVAHFLPGHRVEIWYARNSLLDPKYPGPKYLLGSAPDYIPLSDESPEPKQGKQK